MKTRFGVLLAGVVAVFATGMVTGTANVVFAQDHPPRPKPTDARMVAQPRAAAMPLIVFPDPKHQPTAATPTE